ncbi:MAG: hypothetical protein FJ304_22790 [Planctomycetes bacterium]|nr:hypothetical protein [Planctomycetota bacterium]
MSIRLKILLSYHYYKDVDLDALLEKKFAPHYPEIFIDSGGFSAMTQGVSIDIKAYAAFLKRFAHRITVYANLDSIGNAQKTADNQKRLEDMGLRPIPVFHTGEEWKWLEAYIERYPYIALGGMVPYMRQWEKMMPWLVRAFKMAKDRSVYHGFGCTTWNIISRVPWYSVDSSSWCASFRFGQVGLFDPRTGKWHQANLGDPKTCSKAAPLIRSYGFDPADFADRKRNERKKIAAISALAYIKAEEFLRKRHGAIGLPGQPDGVRLCLATGGDPGIDLANANRTLNESPGGARVYLAHTGPYHIDASRGLNGQTSLGGGATE